MTYEFKENKYTKIYFSLMEKRRKNVLHKKDGYRETHHIIPKSLGGSDDKENLVNLTAREHFIAHRLLTKMTEGAALRSMWWALHRILFSSKDTVHSSRDYEKFRSLWAEWMKENHHSKRIPEWNQKMSDITTKDWEDNQQKRETVGNAFRKSHEDRKKTDPEKYYETQTKNAKKGAKVVSEKWKNDSEWAESQREKLSKALTGEKNGMYGKTHSDEWKERQSKIISRKRWISNDSETIYVDIDLLDDYLKRGYTMGRKFMKQKNGKEESQ